MRLVLFGSGSPMSAHALEALTARGTLVAVVVPGGWGGDWRGWRRSWARRRAARPLAGEARRRRLPVLHFHPRTAGALGARLRRLEPDLACVATFPHLLPPALLSVPARGAIGLHPSLLPRHRGPDPLFWTYHAGDAETGVSVQWLDAGADTGDVVLQEAIAVERGREGRALYLEMAARGARLLAAAVDAIAAGTAPRTPQDEARATREAMPSATRDRVDLAAWDAERLWHFLRGVGPARSFLTTPEGRGLTGGVAAWRAGAEAPPGTMERLPTGWRLHCRDGWVEVSGR
jgi:methionyl-tRNA formyltransferase